MIKKLLIISALLVSGVISYGGQGHYQKPVNITVTTSSTQIIPELKQWRDPKIADFADTTAYSVGDVVRVGSRLSSGSRLYWCVTAGTSGTGDPTHTSGDATSGSAVFRAMIRGRTSALLSNVGTVDVFLAFGYDAEVNKGIVLKAGSTIETPTDKSAPTISINGITASGSAIVAIQER